VIPVPVLLFQAGADQLVMPDGQDAFCAGAPNCRLEYFPDAGHEILMERDDIRNRALDLVRGFLSQH
jgi:alpha-beta hydrolase superfamily lysophospholipase